MPAAIYNTLPSVHDADASFQGREALFAKLAPLLHKYNDQFGVILVHSHTNLKKDEIMLADGDTVRPTVISHEKVYPSHWLSTGEPYEFSRSPTAEPPAGLLEEFQEIVGKDSGLGLYFVGEHDKDVVQSETSEGGVQTVQNIARKDVPKEEDVGGKVTEVGWVTDGIPKGMVANCFYICCSIG